MEVEGRSQLLTHKQLVTSEVPEVIQNMFKCLQAPMEQFSKTHILPEHQLWPGAGWRGTILGNLKGHQRRMFRASEPALINHILAACRPVQLTRGARHKESEVSLQAPSTVFIRAQVTTKLRRVPISALQSPKLTQSSHRNE